MNIDFSAGLLALNGDVLQFSEKGVNRPMLLKDAAIEALLNTSNSLPDGEQKFKFYQLAQRLQPGGPIDVSPEEVVLLKEKIGVAYGANVVGPCYLLLNG